MKKLQVLKDGTWQYVFCYNGGRIVTTKNPAQALGARDLEYFCNEFGNDSFRLEDPRFPAPWSTSYLCEVPTEE